VVDEDDEYHEFERVMSLARGGRVGGDLTRDELRYLVSVRRTLENDDLLGRALDLLHGSDDTVEAACHVLWAKAGRSDCEPAAAAVASRLHELDREAGVALLWRLGVGTADIVLRCDGLVLSGEDWLLGVVLSFRDSVDVFFGRLPRHVRCRHLSGACAAAFFDALDLGFLDAEVLA